MSNQGSKSQLHTRSDHFDRVDSLLARAALILPAPQVHAEAYADAKPQLRQPGPTGAQQHSLMQSPTAKTEMELVEGSCVVHGQGAGGVSRGHQLADRALPGV